MKPELVQIGGRTVETRSCGECSLCCKVFDIFKADGLPFDKPAHQWCRYFTAGMGCTIHNKPEFPHVCRDFLCAWKFPELGMPEDARPDKIHAVVWPHKPLPEFPNVPIFRVTVDYKNPAALKNMPQLMDRLKESCDRGTAFVVVVGPVAFAMTENLQIRGALAAWAKQEEREIALGRVG